MRTQVAAWVMVIIVLKRPRKRPLQATAREPIAAGKARTKINTKAFNMDWSLSQITDPSEAIAESFILQTSTCWSRALLQ